ncbi:hypothetical protein [Saccharopolyspora flava]|uniref:Uncharacterized protein n=1 Tax=Saccharopolyspora flava TaxID=95161 RepID=A0A1I6QT30_9PSEU|nr:hypothetical protein [Saccharopolyspora flava]SFS55564.1 hypothetical protein SAMN05660874_01825 [Saccharopolyspora flava]
MQNEPARRGALSGAAIAVVSGLVVTVVGGAAVLVFEYGAVQKWFAPATTTWTTDRSVTDIAGMTASGEVVRSDDGLVHLTGTVQDTDADGEGAALLIDVADGGRREEFPEYHTRGANRTINVGGREAGRVLPATVESISVRECLTTWKDARKSDVVLDHCGAAPLEIWNSSRS